MLVVNEKVPPSLALPQERIFAFVRRAVRVVQNCVRRQQFPRAVPRVGVGKANCFQRLVAKAAVEGHHHGPVREDIRRRICVRTVAKKHTTGIKLVGLAG